MKSTIEQPREKEVEVEFPILMEWIPDDENKRKNAFLVVSFHSHNCGTVVGAKNVARKIGEHSTGFINAKDSSYWKKFTGKVTLENS